MQSDLSFLPNNLSADLNFQSRWRHAVMVVNMAAKSDKDRGGAHRKKAIHAAAGRTISAARLIINEIDRGAFAQLIPVEHFIVEYGLSNDDVQTVRRFLNVLRQDTLVLAQQEAERIPNILIKQGTRKAAHFAGRLCAEFGLGEPTDYAQSDHVGESVSIRLMRCLLIESKADRTPSNSTLRRGMPLAKEGYYALLDFKTSTSD